MSRPHGSSPHDPLWGGRDRSNRPTEARQEATSPGQAYQPHQANLLSAAVAAARVGVCTRTLKSWITRGWLPATRTPSPKDRGHLRIRPGDLDALLAQGVLR